eukprot:SAG31_NODE_1327_length_8759_cov_4.689723_3_plen_204_part_00
MASIEPTENIGWHHSNQRRKTKQEIFAEEQALMALPTPTEDVPDWRRLRNPPIQLHPGMQAAGGAPREAPLQGVAPFARDDQVAHKSIPTKIPSMAPFAREGDQQYDQPTTIKRSGKAVASTSAVARDSRPPFGVDDVEHNWHRSQEYKPIGEDASADELALGAARRVVDDAWRTGAASASTQSSRETARLAMARNRGAGGLW